MNEIDALLQKVQSCFPNREWVKSNGFIHSNCAFFLRSNTITFFADALITLDGEVKQFTSQNNDPIAAIITVKQKASEAIEQSIQRLQQLQQSL